MSEFKKLKEKILKCQNCDLYKTVTNKVIGKGSLSPDVLLIGEAPGKNEDETGIAFCGIAGKKLDEIISIAKIENYAIINAIKCHPPGNRNPLTQELAACKPFFKKQIELLKPKKIIALGKIALAQLGLQSDTILSRVGTIEESKFGEVFIAPHPSYLVRNSNYSFPYSALESFLYEKKNENTADKELLVSYNLNKQEAENLAKFEMISSELAAIHYFCKKADKTFVDVNQKDLCKVDGKLAFVIETNETDLIKPLEEKISKSDKAIELVIFVSYKNTDITCLGWVNRQRQEDLGDFIHMNKLLPIYIEKKEEKIIEKQPFVHLHSHSEFSIGDGYGTVKQIAESLYNKGFSACALTDHGTLAGSIYWQKALLAKGIKPIIGSEIYLIMEKGNEAKYFHLILLAKNETGWKNLLKLNALAVYDNFYYRPRTFIGDVIENKEGLIVSTACLSGYSSRMFLDNKPDKAEEFLLMLHKEFGDDFYVELMPNRIPIQRTYNEFLLEMIKKHDFKYIITTDSHYPEANQEKFHKAVKAISRRTTYEEAGFDDDTFYLQTADDIKKLMKENHPLITSDIIDQAFKYSLEVADKCNFEIKPFTKDTLPKLYDNAAEKLKKLTYEGLSKFTPHSLDDIKIKERIDMELDRFISKKYENYFLIVHDYVKWCKGNGIMVGPGRGSVGGSLAAYALNITEVDPLEFDLLFARFLSPIRRDAPDIDLDFEDEKRKDLIQYLKDKYNERNNAKVITYSRWHPKGVMRDIGRIFGISNAEINKVCNVVISRCISGNSKILLTNGEEKEVQELYQDYQKEKNAYCGRKKRKMTFGISWDLQEKYFREQAIKNVYSAGEKQLYEITTSTGKKIEASEDHKFLTKTGWKKLKDLSEEEEIMTYAEGFDFVKCKVCGRIMRDVNTDHLKKHGMNQEQYKKKFGTRDLCKDVSIKRGWQLNRPYIGRKLFGKDNPMANPEVKKRWYQKINEKGRREKHSKWMKKNNPMFNKETASKIMKNFCKIKKEGSKPQWKLFKIIQKYYKGELGFDHYIKTKRNYRLLDVALIKEKIDFEFDGSFWHKGMEREDAMRRKEIEEMGWKVISIIDKTLNENFIQKKLKALQCLKK